MSSLAQEESRSISENTTWGKRKQFADGKWSIPYSRFLGYDMGADGKVVINPEEAEVVKKIFRLFLEGYSYTAIAKKLTEEGVRTAAGKDKWYYTSVEYVLTNEKYRGDVLIQKSFTTDYLTKKKTMWKETTSRSSIRRLLIWYRQRSRDERAVQ